MIFFLSTCISLFIRAISSSFSAINCVGMPYTNILYYKLLLYYEYIFIVYNTIFSPLPHVAFFFKKGSLHCLNVHWDMSRIYSPAALFQDWFFLVFFCFFSWLSIFFSSFSTIFFFVYNSHMFSLMHEFMLDLTCPMLYRHLWCISRIHNTHIQSIAILVRVSFSFCRYLACCTYTHSYTHSYTHTHTHTHKYIYEYEYLNRDTSIGPKNVKSFCAT